MTQIALNWIFLHQMLAVLWQGTMADRSRDFPHPVKGRECPQGAGWWGYVVHMWSISYRNSVDLSPDHVLLLQAVYRHHCTLCGLCTRHRQCAESAEVRTAYKITPGQGNSVCHLWEGLILRNRQRPSSRAVAGEDDKQTQFEGMATKAHRDTEQSWAPVVEQDQNLIW